MEGISRQLHPFRVGFFISKISYPVIVIFIFAACIVWVTDRVVLLLKKVGENKMTELKECYCPMCFRDHMAIVLIDTEDRLTGGLVLDKPRVPCNECLGVEVQGGRC